jgi:hypothetical protein
MSELAAASAVFREVFETYGIDTTPPAQPARRTIPVAAT